MLQLILKDEDFPYDNFIKEERRRGCKDPTLITTQMKQKMLKELNYENKAKVLAQHQMFKNLQGNPTSISMIASIYQAEKFKFYQNDSSMLKDDNK